MNRSHVRVVTTQLPEGCRTERWAPSAEQSWVLMTHNIIITEQAVKSVRKEVRRRNGAR